MLPVRGHNQGTIFQRRKGLQKGSWVSAVTMRDGRRASRTTHSRDDARAALVELIRLRDAGATMTGRIRLGDYLLRWVSDGTSRMGPATRRKHESIIRNHLAPALGAYRLSDLSVVEVRQYLNQARGDPQSVRHHRATLRRVLADALRDGLVTRNVAALAEPPKLPSRERTVLDATQARLLIESTRGTRYGPLWTILVTTGLRISEALGLAWSDVDLGGNDVRSPIHSASHPDRLGDSLERPREATVVPPPGRGDRVGRHLPGREDRDGRNDLHVGTPSLTVRHQLARENGEWVRRPPKTAKGRRTIPLTPLGVEALRAQRDQQREDRGIAATDGLVFTSERGHPLHGTNLLPKLRADLAAAGLPKVGLHDMRHSAATILYAMGLPMPAIADILGHADARITEQLYRHHVQEFSVLAAERMQEALG